MTQTTVAATTNTTITGTTNMTITGTRTGGWWSRRPWLHMFLGGLGLWVAAVAVTFITQNVNLVPTIILLGSFLVPVTFVAYAFGRADQVVTAQRILTAFVYGGALGVLGASLLEAEFLNQPSIPTYLGVGLIEEAVKLAALWLLARRLPRYTMRDGIVLGAAVGFGFAALESAGYAFNALFISNGLSLINVVETEVLRGILAPVGHGLWPVHTWLPDAHVEAPTAGSVILAGILLKMGGYGFVRVSLPMFPDASTAFAPLVFALSVVAIVYTSLVALMQDDIKKLIAYSSVAHMGFVTMGLFTMTPQGIQGAMFTMVSHGLVSGALFLCVGVIYDRMHTREIAAYGGLVNRMPLYALAMMIFTMANVGLPGTSGFVGEFLSLVGAFRANPTVAFFATTGVILSAGYALWLYSRVIYGRLEKPTLQNIADLNVREIVILAPLAVLVIYYGVKPGPILDAFAGPTDALIQGYQAAMSLTKTAALPLH